MHTTNGTMRAAMYHSYGPPEVVEVKEITKPIPKDNEVLVRIRASTITAADFRMRSFTVPKSYWLPARIAIGFNGPRRKIQGLELAGDVETVGSKVTKFKAGDRVWAFPGFTLGAHAEYLCVREDNLITHMPDSLSYEEMAGLGFGAFTANSFYKKARITPGDEVLVYGASGAVGTAAVQLATYLGARVTGVCSTANLELVKSLGAAAVVDYTKTDILKESEGRFDLIFECVGKTSFQDGVKALKPDGYYLHAVGEPKLAIRMGLASIGSKRTFVGGTKMPNHDDMEFLKKLTEEKKFRVVIDRSYPLEEIVEAHRYVDQGHKKGNVIITMG